MGWLVQQGGRSLPSGFEVVVLLAFFLIVALAGIAVGVGVSVPTVVQLQRKLARSEEVRLALLYERDEMIQTEAAQLAGAFSPGDRVWHPQYGDGTVVSLRGAGQLASALVRFDGERASDERAEIGAAFVRSLRRGR